MILHPKRVLQLASKMDWASEFPEDYLQLYANCDTVYTDRVHACVAALIYGNKAMYFGKSPRYGLLPRVLQGADITKEPVSLNLDYVAQEKQKQLDFLDSVLNR
jgi:fibrillarin-like rRNA methylase